MRSSWGTSQDRSNFIHNPYLALRNCYMLNDISILRGKKKSELVLKPDPSPLIITSSRTSKIGSNMEPISSFSSPTLLVTNPFASLFGIQLY